jgi:conjugal transfer mating pair stabilization protein TraN
MNLSLALLLILALSPLALAGQEATFNAHLNWAKGATTSTQAKSEFALTPEDYCNDTSCKTQLHAPQQTQLSSSALESKAQAQYLTNEGAQAINDGFSKGRPSIENDPTYEFALLAQENAYEISHGLSNPFVDCTSGTLCSLINVQKTCKAPTNTPLIHVQTPTLVTDIRPISTYSCPSGTRLQGNRCVYTERQCRYDRQNLVTKTTRKSREWCFSEGMSYRWNGKEVNRNGFSQGGSKKKYNTSRCKVQEYQICGSVTKSRSATAHCPSGYTLTGDHCSKKIVTWPKSRPTGLISECQSTNNVCVEGSKTKIIDGIRVSLPCWKYETTFQCQTTNTCDALSECTNVSKTCSLMQQGVCVEETLTKSCQEKSCQANTLQCGETSFCLDGDCYDATPTQSDDFHTSVSALAAISAAAEDLGEPPTMFKGTAMKCEKKAAGINDCCKDSGWGQSLGMSCSPEEEALGKAKEGKLTIYVGQYCAKKILGVCTRKKHSYCVYDSKLARIIQEQGTRHQLGVSNGSAKHPTCNPITPEQLQQINFEHLDFSDFYGDMNDNMALPSQNEIQSRLQNNVN